MLTDAAAALVGAVGLARHAPATETDPADYDAAMGLNLRAAFFLTREVARRLIAAKRPGSLVTGTTLMVDGGPIGYGATSCCLPLQSYAR